MTGERHDALRLVILALAVSAALTSCLEWEPVDGDVAPGDPDPPVLTGITPSSAIPVSSFDPGDAAGRCRIACRRYDECFGPLIDVAVCQSRCGSEGWILDSRDLGCFVWSGCSDLWRCIE